LGQRTVIYARVSTNDQSCQRQIDDLTNFAERAGYQVGQVFKETISGTKINRKERNKVMSLAQSRVLYTLNKLAGWNVSLIAMSGLTLELNTPHGHMMATILSGIAQFERDLISERVKSGLAAAKARGKVLGRKPGFRPKSDKYAAKVLSLVDQGRSYRWIARDLGISKNTVSDIIKRSKANN